MTRTPRPPEQHVTYDVFDTVLTRAVGTPAAVFLLLGRELAADGLIHCSAEVFAHQRRAAEHAARWTPDRVDVTLAEIYAELVTHLGDDCADAVVLAQRELDLERRLLRPVPGARDRVARDRKAGATIAFLSDMYLPETFVADVLTEHDIRHDGETVLVSGERRRTKAGGQLFEDYRELTGVASAALRHVGDNAHSDVHVPRSLGIAADEVADARLTRYEQRCEDHRFATGGLSSLLAGASRMARLTTDAANAHEQALTTVAAGVAGPTLVAYVLWILRQAKRQELDRLYFVARDGEVLLDLARELAPATGCTAELRYLEGSRRAWQLASHQPGTLALADWPLDGLYPTPLVEVLERLDLTFADLPPDALRSAGLTQDMSFRRDDPEAARLRELLASVPVAALVELRARSRRALVERYLRAQGFGDGARFAIVDTGWTGRSQRALVDVLAGMRVETPRVLLFGHSKYPDGWNSDVIQPYLFDEPSGRGWVGAVPVPHGQIEMFCAAAHGSVVGYEEVGDEVRPILASTRDEPAIAWGVTLVRDVIRRFGRELAASVRDVTLDLDADLRALVVELTRLFWLEADPAEAKEWATFPFEDDPLGRSRRPVAWPFGLRDVVRAVWIRDYPADKRLWLEGSLAITPPFVLRGFERGRRGLGLLRRARPTRPPTAKP